MIEKLKEEREPEVDGGVPWKMVTKVSDNLLVSSASGNSRKYCLTISATS